MRYLQEKGMAEVYEMDFVITDESVNRYGYRILVDGIKLDGFLKNPVCCFQHNTWAVSIGRWKNLKVTDGKLIGTLEFDSNDDEAIKLYHKYKNGYMNAVSLAIVPLEESNDPQHLLPGQTYPTVTKSELLEISLVTIPGQQNAVKLMKPDGTLYQLKLITRTMKNDEKNLEQLQQELEQLRRLNAENLVTLHKNRGVVANDEYDTLMQLALVDYDSVKRLLESRKQSESELAIKAKQLLAMHQHRLGLTADEAMLFEKAATVDYELTQKVLEMRKGKDPIDRMLGSMHSSASGKDDRSTWDYLDWYKRDLDGLMLMVKNDPERYKQLEADFLKKNQEQGVTITQPI